MKIEFDSDTPKQSHKLDEDSIQYIKEMLEDGLTPRNIARYIGVSETTIRYIISPKKRWKWTKTYYKKNRESLLKKMREYAKEYNKRPENIIKRRKYQKEHRKTK